MDATKTIQHTPGPWQVGPPATWYRVGVRSIHGPRRGVIARVIRFLHADSSDPEALANARLIAAAPELLQTLKDILHNAVVMNQAEPSRVWSAIQDAAEAAIAKAEGR